MNSFNAARDIQGAYFVEGAAIVEAPAPLPVVEPLTAGQIADDVAFIDAIIADEQADADRRGAEREREIEDGQSWRDEADHANSAYPDAPIKRLTSITITTTITGFGVQLAWEDGIFETLNTFDTYTAAYDSARESATQSWTSVREDFDWLARARFTPGWGAQHKG